MHYRLSIKWKAPPSFNIFLGLFSSIYLQITGIWLSLILLLIGLTLNCNKALFLITLAFFGLGFFIIPTTANGITQFYGYVISVDSKNFYQQIQARNTIDNQKYYINYYGLYDIKPGYFIRTHLNPVTLRRSHFPGIYDHFIFRSTTPTGATKQIQIIPKFRISRYNLLDIIPIYANLTRNLIAIKLDTHIDNNFNIAKNMVIGKVAKLDYREIKTIKNMGASHIIAISGLHIGIIMAIFMFISITACNILQINIKFGLIPAMLMCAFYMFISGLSSSVVRAGSMILLSCSLIMNKIYISTANALFLVASIMLLLKPAYAIHPGYQLSVMAMLAIVTCNAKTENILKNIFYYIYMSYSIVAFTSPVVGLHFNQWQLIGILANIVYIPLGILTIILIVIGVLLPYSNWAFTIADYILNLMLTESSIKSIATVMPSYSIVFAIAMGGIALLLRNSKASTAICASICLIFTAFGQLWPDTQPNIINTGKEILIYNPSAKVYTYCGRKNSYVFKYWQLRFKAIEIGTKRICKMHINHS